MALSGWAIFIILLVVVIVLGGGGYILYTHYRARRLGLPPPPLNPFNRSRRTADQPTYRAPAPAPGGIQGWFSDKFSALRNKRTAGGAYEGTGVGGARGTGRGRQGFGPLDPDGAWDSRVDNEADAYYEEQELGLQDPGPYGGSGYSNNQHIGVGGIREERGRSRSRQRELDDRYDEEMHGGSTAYTGARGADGGLNPFGDQNAAPSLRSVSPRPEIDTSGKSHKKGQSSLGTNEDNSPTERRSMFREEV